jgi:hypothetical protein
MAYYVIPLQAGVEYRQDVIGSVILVDSIDGANGVDITPIQNGTPLKTMPGRQVAFKYRVSFDAVILKAAANCTVSIFLTTNDVDLGFTDGSLVNVQGGVVVNNDAASPIPVAIGAGSTVNVTADNVGINNSNANAVPVKNQALAVIVDHAPAVINTGAAQLLVNDATLRRLRVRNAHATALVFLGGAGVTPANAAILLQPGDIWVEDDAAGASWYAVSDTNGADVRVTGLK